jgi:glycosyltransferase involved in cell wall biosynthesis
LVTDIASFRRITDNGRVGAIVPVGQSDALAREIVRWTRMDRPALRREARAYFERELSIDAVGRQLRESYENMVGGSRARETGDDAPLRL